LPYVSSGATKHNNLFRTHLRLPQARHNPGTISSPLQRQTHTLSQETQRKVRFRSPLLQQHSFRHFPLSHTRQYIHRIAGKAINTETNAGFPATVLIGSQKDFDYNAFAELSFVDAGAFQTFFGIYQQPENAAQIAADKEQFLNRSQSKSSLNSERHQNNGGYQNSRLQRTY
ncbi:hypothetical protein diail_8875, partial [Diaporthe ilicicola]